jgi:hypothetical protein
MTQYRQAPQFETPLMDDKQTTSKFWYRYFQASETGQPPTGETAITVTASPFVYTAPRKGYVIVSGGTITNIQISRSGTYYSMGASANSYPVAANDMLKVTYTGIPTMVFFPT